MSVLGLAVWISGGGGVATAAPRFDAEVPADAALAAAAWEAAAACTGREGRAHEVVTIGRRVIPGDYLGVAHTDAAGRLFRIDLNTQVDRHREVLVHEVAHAWVSEGPIALLEGSAELLADCVAARVPGIAPLQWDDGRELTGLPDLREWSVPREDAPAELGAIRTDAYLGAARLLRTAARVVDPRVLLADPKPTWEAFEGHLAAAGAPGEALLEALRGGAGAQRRALADADRDGVTTLAESWLGTDDGRFDSDGDGWWDGAHDVPADALAVPLDGTPVCSGWAAPEAGASVAVLGGGNLRGTDVPIPVARAGSHPATWAPARREGHGPSRALVPGGASVLVQLDGPPTADSAGAWWARVQGEALVPDPACRSTVGVTVWAHDPALAARVPALVEALERAEALATDRFGPGPGRVAVALGGRTSTVEGAVVWLSSRDVAAASPDELAQLAVSLRRLWAAGERDWTAGEALARSLGR